VSSGAETPDDVAARVLREHKEKQRVREEAERAEGVLPARSFSPDPPSVPADKVPELHGAIEVDGEILMIGIGYANLATELQALTNGFVVKVAAANGDRDWQAQLATEYLLTAREICLKMIG